MWMLWMPDELINKCDIEPLRCHRNSTFGITSIGATTERKSEETLINCKTNICSTCELTFRPALPICNAWKSIVFDWLQKLHRGARSLAAFLLLWFYMALEFRLNKITSKCVGGTEGGRCGRLPNVLCLEVCQQIQIFAFIRGSASKADSLSLSLCR